MPTKLFTSRATYPNNIVIPPVALRHPAYYNSQASTHRADYSMSGQAASATPSSTMEVTTAADLAKLRADGKPLTSQERRELNTRIKAFEEMAQIEDRLQALESRKRQRPTKDPDNDEYLGRQEQDQTGESPMNHERILSRHSTIRPSIELEDSESSSSSTLTHRWK